MDSHDSDFLIRSLQQPGLTKERLEQISQELWSNDHGNGARMVLDSAVLSEAAAKFGCDEVDKLPADFTRIRDETCPADAVPPHVESKRLVQPPLPVSAPYHLNPIAGAFHQDRATVHQRADHGHPSSQSSVWDSYAQGKQEDNSGANGLAPTPQDAAGTSQVEQMTPEGIANIPLEQNNQPTATSQPTPNPNMAPGRSVIPGPVIRMRQ